ncbi:MAG: cytochrome C assembly family protein [Thermoanaerobaculia bacterium]
MGVGSADFLNIALAFYGAGAIVTLASLVVPSKRAHHVAFVTMVAGFVAHTIFIGTICVRTGHPPLANLPEAAAFISWTILFVELALYVRYHVYAAAFFVYPLAFLLLGITRIVGEPFAPISPALRSSLFTTHVLLTTTGVAGLFIGLSFELLALAQDRSLKSKTRGPLWDWIPSLDICNSVSQRALNIGFIVYTVGLAAGMLWSYRTTAGVLELGAKQIGAVVAWILFAILLRSRARRTTIILSAGAFAAVTISILGIAHV